MKSLSSENIEKLQKWIWRFLGTTSNKQIIHYNTPNYLTINFVMLLLLFLNNNNNIIPWLKILNTFYNTVFYILVEHALPISSGWSGIHLEYS